MEAINRRYKRLVLAWHPDRFHNEEGKREAEQELKAINHARDLLKIILLKGGHKETGSCACRAESSQQSARSRQSAGGPGPGPRRTNNTEGTKREAEAGQETRLTIPAGALRRKLHTKPSNAAKAAHERGDA